MRGQRVCNLHGGKSPQALAATARRAEEEAARAAVARLGAQPLTVTGIEALEAMLYESAGNVAVLRVLVGELDLNAETGIAVRTGSTSRPAETEPHVLVRMYDAERDRLTRVAKECVALGLDERRVRVAEGAAGRFIDVVTAAMAEVGLTPEQVERFHAAVVRGLRALPVGGAAAHRVAEPVRPGAAQPG